MSDNSFTQKPSPIFTIIFHELTFFIIYEKGELIGALKIKAGKKIILN